MSILVTRSSMPDFDEYVEEIKSIFESHHLTNMGPIYKKLQHQLMDYLSVPELSMFVNGHMALETVLQAMDFRDGAEVITTPFTFVSTTNAIVRNGLVPVFCDINPVDFTIDVTKIESLITDKTVAILPVHVYGNICDVEAIADIASKYNLKVIYDAAHAFGVKYKGVGIGNFGDASMFSFHATKVFNTIEGGAISFKSEDLKKPLHELKNFGMHGQEDVEDFGGNAKMDEFRAAMGICNLRHIDGCIESRGKAYDRYVSRLDSVPGITICKTKEDVLPNYAYFPAMFDASKFGKSRDDVFEALKANDIHARKYFYPAINEMSCYEGRFTGITPVAHDVSLNILTLPMYEELSVEEVDKICDVILGVCGE